MLPDGAREEAHQKVHRAVGHPVVVEREDLCSAVSWDESSALVKGSSVKQNESLTNQDQTCHRLRICFVGTTKCQFRWGVR